jgi:hypothetical protein
MTAAATPSGTAPPSGESSYQHEPAAAVGGPVQGDIKTGDLAAISATRLLVAERDSQNGGPFRRRSHLDLAGATNVLGRDDFGGRTPEQLSDADPAAAGVTPARKTFVPASARTAGPSPAGCPRSCT